MKNRGMALLTALLFLIIMLLMVASNLYISQLSMKSAQAAQQQLQLEYHALQHHLSQLSGLDPTELPPNTINLAACPGVYAAWSDAALQCELLFLETSMQSKQVPLVSRYNSLVLRKRITLPEGGL